MNIMNNKIYKVVKLDHLKAQDYEVTIQNEQGSIETFSVHEEVVLKYRLVAGKEITSDQYNELHTKLDLGRAYQYALNLLSRKSYTTAEVYQKLEQKEYSIEMIREVIERLTAVGLLNDEQYTISYISHHAIMGKKGPVGISQELMRKGISERLINEHLKLYEVESQVDNIEKLINQMVRANHKYGPHYLKQKIYQNLLNKGFNRSLIDQAINAALNDQEENDDSILLKEMEKLFRKHRLLSERDKKSKIITTLMRKGFSYDDISRKYRELIELNDGTEY